MHFTKEMLEDKEFCRRHRTELGRTRDKIYIGAFRKMMVNRGACWPEPGDEERFSVRTRRWSFMPHIEMRFVCYDPETFAEREPILKEYHVDKCLLLRNGLIGVVVSEHLPDRRVELEERIAEFGSWWRGL